MAEACGPDKCVYHDINETIIEDLKNAVKVLLDGQQDLKLSVIQLTEAFKSMDRIESKVDKMEVVFGEKLEKVERAYLARVDRMEQDFKERLRNLEIRQAEMDKDQNDKIDKLKAFMYKIAGGIAAVYTAGSVALKLIGV